MTSKKMKTVALCACMLMAGGVAIAATRQSLPVVASAGQEATRPHLAPVIAGIANLSEVLANDDFEGGKAALDELMAAVGGIDAAALPKEQAVSWEKAMPELTEVLAESPKDIGALRQQLSRLTDVVRPIFDQSGGMSGYSLAFCPMALQGKGAFWIQSEGQVRNPYLGAMMLNCGEITKPGSETPKQE